MATTSPYTAQYTYLASDSGTGTTPLLSNLRTVINGDIVYYRNLYDSKGNITAQLLGSDYRIRYTYDNLNQLTRENNRDIAVAGDANFSNGKSITYTYDAGGNITGKKEYAYITGTLGSPVNTYTYTYGDANWKDKLTAYNGKAITYDAMGNPKSYDGWAFEWTGSRLESLKKTGSNNYYFYNDERIRVGKTVNGKVTDYYLNGSAVVCEKSGGDVTSYSYDEKGDLFGMTLNGTNYYYVRNMQNDITGILDSAGVQVVSYVYDTWGKLISISGTQASTVGVKNPYRCPRVPVRYRNRLVLSQQPVLPSRVGQVRERGRSCWNGL